MALVRFELKHHTRGSTASTVSHAAYILRTRNQSEDHAAYLLRQSQATAHREDLVHAEWGNLPAWAHDNPLAFFAAADTYERSNARVSSTLEIALPRELARADQIALMQDFCTSQFPQHPYAVALHESPASDGQPQPHFHVVYSTRCNDGLERTAAEYFRRYNPLHPAQGGAQKDPIFLERGMPYAQRQAWCDLANLYLERGGVAVRVDPRSLTARGLDRTPEPRLAPLHSTQAKYRHTHSPQWQAVLEQRHARHAHDAQEHTQAQAYWAHRKQELGLTPDMSRTAIIATIAAQTRAQALAPTSRQQALARDDAQIDLTALHTHIARLRGEVIRHEHYAVQGKAPTPAMRQQVQRLLTQAATLGLEERSQGAGLRMSLKDRSRDGYERDEGYAW